MESTAWMDCEQCVYWKKCFSENKDPDEALKALEKLGCCDICIEDSMQD